MHRLNGAPVNASSRLTAWCDTESMRSRFFNLCTFVVPQRMQWLWRENKNVSVTLWALRTRLTRRPHFVQRKMSEYTSFCSTVRCVLIKCFPQSGHGGMLAKR